MCNYFRRICQEILMRTAPTYILPAEKHPFRATNCKCYSSKGGYYGDATPQRNKYLTFEV